MSIEPGNKVIPVTSKFTSELNPSDPDDAEEMRKRVFGRNYETDRNGDPVMADRGSDAFYVSDARLPADPLKASGLKEKIRSTFVAHINAIRLRGGGDPANGPYLEAADIEKARINELRRRKDLPPLSA